MSHLTLTEVGQDLDRIVKLDASQPTIGDGDALVAIEAAPVNNADILFAAGWFGLFPDVPGDLGGEGVGRVVRVGAGVDQALVGRRVLVLPTFKHGTWAQETVVPAGRMIPVPEDVDALQLATLPVEAATAYAVLHDFVALSTGDWIGLNLANSTVGHYLVPLARRAGIRTLAVVRREAAAKPGHPAARPDLPQHLAARLLHPRLDPRHAARAARGHLRRARRARRAARHQRRGRATYALDQFPVALAHAQRTARSGKVHFTLMPPRTVTPPRRPFAAR